MKRVWLSALAPLLVVAVLASCTPEQIAAIEKFTGEPVSNAERDALLALPDAPVQVGDRIFETDGTSRRLVAPEGSSCPEFFDEAMGAGWTAADWPRLDAIIHRESRCNPNAYNGVGPDDSYGLMQLNMNAHRGWVNPLLGWDLTRLYDPAVNLWVARVLHDRALVAYGCGWQPWAYGC